MSPTFTAEFAAVPRTVWKGTSAADRIRLRLCRSDTFALSLTRFSQHRHKLPDIEMIVVPGAPTDHVPITHASLVDEFSAAQFYIQLALGDGRHAFASNHAGGPDDLGAVA